VSTVRLRLGEQTREVRLEDGIAVVGDREIRCERRYRDGRLVALVVDGAVHRVRVAREADRVLVWCDGRSLTFDRARARRAAPPGAHAEDLISPMPGTVRRTFVAAGDRVTRGQLLLVLEAMKMEHSIRAPRDGVVRRLLVREGQMVEAGVELAEIG
jgi:biotin carboxyl carrier protein